MMGPFKSIMGFLQSLDCSKPILPLEVLAAVSLLF